MCDECILNIFIRPKTDGRVRLTFNLKVFNEYHVEKTHFKMESLRSAIAAIRNQSTESAESRKLLEQQNLLNGVGMLDTFDLHHQVKTDRRVTFMLCLD